jgi:ABC-type uncharacterized transport system substrate-binding protein
MIRKFLILIASASIFLIATACKKAEEWEGNPVTGKRWKIDVLKYINNSYTATFEEQLKVALSNSGLQEKRDYKIRVRSAQGEMSNVTAIIDAALAQESDLLILFQAPTLYTALSKAPNTKKVFTLLQNPFILGAGGSDTQHSPNITGFYVVPPIAELLEKVAEMIPPIKSVGTLYMIGNEDSIDRKNELVKLAKQRGLEVFEQGYNTQNDIMDSSAALFGKNPDAVIHLMDPAQDITFPALYQHARQRRKPLFSLVYNMEKLGATIVCSTDRDQIGLRFGEMVSRILKGADPTTMPFENDIPLPKHFRVNRTAASEAKVTLPPSLLTSN